MYNKDTAPSNGEQQITGDEAAVEKKENGEEGSVHREEMGGLGWRVSQRSSNQTLTAGVTAKCLRLITVWLLVDWLPGAACFLTKKVKCDLRVWSQADMDNCCSVLEKGEEDFRWVCLMLLQSSLFKSNWCVPPRVHQARGYELPYSFTIHQTVPNKQNKICMTALFFFPPSSLTLTSICHHLNRFLETKYEGNYTNTWILTV